MLALLLLACTRVEGEPPAKAIEDPGSAQPDTGDTGGSGDTGDTADSADTGGADDTGDSGDTGDDPPLVVYDPWPFIDLVVDFSPGPGAGYGQDRFPDVVFGPPEAPGGGAGSLDVLSLGVGGILVAQFRDGDLVDGDGVDLLVFENPFAGWAEPAVIGVSDDGVTWTEWPCAAEDADGGYPGCAGVALVYASSTNGVDATDPDAAGGDHFDLADIGVSRARFVRVRDAGLGDAAGVASGFDLDAMAARWLAAR